MFHVIGCVTTQRSGLAHNLRTGHAAFQRPGAPRPSLVAAHQERALQVHPNHSIKVLLVHLQEIGSAYNACIGHGNVQPAKPAYCGRHHRIHFRFIADIARAAGSLDALFLQPRRRRLCSCGVNIGQEHLGASTAQRLGASVADACGSEGQGQQAASAVRQQSVHPAVDVNTLRISL
jgi:hypothetical protein